MSSIIPQSTVAVTVAAILANTAITSHALGRIAESGNVTPNGALLSFRGVTAGVGNFGALSFGFDAVYSRNTNNIVIYAAGDFSISPFSTFKKRGKGRFVGDWAIGPIWNLKNAKSFGGVGASAKWPSKAFHLLCRMGAIRSGPIWGYACQSRKLSINRQGTTIGFGFSGFSNSSTAFMSLSRGTDISSSIVGWGSQLYDVNLNERIKRIAKAVSLIKDIGELTRELMRLNNAR
ncbi:MAG: hypothetical protein DWP95_06200 [Proteobacteria bacterium]|nr:MAG: hypothetical protein DWP95_06200 [Pseudomonadota bacterium]